MISHHLTEYAGIPVVEFNRDQPLDNPQSQCSAIRIEYESDETFHGLLAMLLQDPGADRLAGLVVGVWSSDIYEDPYSSSAAMVIEPLVAAAPRLPSLKALFLGDIISEENEISWIEQSDVSPLWGAFPNLEYFTVRGSNGLSLGRLEHGMLRSLAIECGGLPAVVMKQIEQSSLPSLEHLELYLGDGNYGFDASIDDIMAMLRGSFPKLRYLGLRDSEIADALAQAIVDAPILSQLEILDLSLGTLSDQGADALLHSDAIGKLKKLDLHYHFLSEEMTQRVEQLPIEVDVSDRQQPDAYEGEEYRYIAVSE